MFAAVVRHMWIFYTAVAGLILVCTLFVTKMPADNAREDEVESREEVLQEKGSV